MALAILDCAGTSPRELTSPVVIARAIGLPVRKVPATAMRGARGLLCRIEWKWTVFVSDVLPPEEVRFVVGHELAEHYLKTRGIDLAGLDKEAFCDQVSANIVAPPEQFREAVREHGLRLAPLARDFAVTQTCVALRFAEVVGITVGVDTPDGPRLRGPAHDKIRSAADVRRLAQARRPYGVHKVRLTDQWGRVAVFPA